MRIPQSGLRLDSPSWPLLQAQISYWGITDAAGNALGTTLIDTLCSLAGLQPNYAGLAVKILDGPAAGQVREIAIHNLATGTITVAAAWTNPAGGVQQITASIRFAILSSGGGGGAPPPPPPPPEVGLWMFGMCDPGMAASLNTLVLTNLAGFNDDIFNNEFWVQVIHNFNAPGIAPEREIRRILDYVGATGTFTVDPFTANVEANDLVCVFHESIMGIEILGYGTLTVSSATVPADAGRIEAAGYFDGCLLLPTEGACRFQPRRIVQWGGPPGGVFTIDPNYPFTAATGLVDYIIIGDQSGFEWPYIEAKLHVMDGPDLNQADIEICRLSLHNLRPDGAVIPIAEYQGTLIDIDRYRWGVDANWVASPIAGAAMIENPGFANYTYTWPAPFWQLGDFFRLTVYGTIIRLPAGTPAGIQDIYIGPQTYYGVVGGLSNIKKKLNLVFDIVNAILKLTETGGTLTTDGTEQIIYINDNPLGVYEPRKVKIDMSNMDWGDTTILRWYERLNGTGSLILKDEKQFEDVQDADLGKPPIKNIELEPNRFGVQVTLQQVAGTYRAFDWEVFYEV